MDTNIGDRAETEEQILIFEISDDVLERTAGTASGTALTWIYCTQVWYNCGWPQ
jgi:hypothetical protein